MLSETLKIPLKCIRGYKGGDLRGEADGEGACQFLILPFPCKSLSPTHMPMLPARLHSCFSTCSSHVGDPVVICLPHSPLALSQSLALSLPSSLFSLFPVLSHPLLSPQRTLAKGQDSLHTPSNVPSLHPFHSSVSQGDSLCSVLSQIVMTTFISLVG